MSKYFIEDTTLTGIGDAIRAKNGSSELIPVTGLASAITNLPTGGGFTPPADCNIITITSTTNSYSQNISGLPSISSIKYALVHYIENNLQDYTDANTAVYIPEIFGDWGIAGGVKVKSGTNEQKLCSMIGEYHHAGFNYNYLKWLFTDNGDGTIKLELYMLAEKTDELTTGARAVLPRETRSSAAPNIVIVYKEEA